MLSLTSLQRLKQDNVFYKQLSRKSAWNLKKNAWETKNYPL